MLRNDPNLRCKSNSECLERVLSENSVYIQVNIRIINCILTWNINIFWVFAELKDFNDRRYGTAS